MEPVTITVEAVFGESLVPGDLEFLAESFGVCPGARFKLEELEVGGVILVFLEIVSDFMEEIKAGGGSGGWVFGVENGAGRMKTEAVAGGDDEIGVGEAELSDELTETWHRNSTRK